MTESYYTKMRKDPNTAKYYRKSRREYNRQLYAENAEYRAATRRANLARYHQRAAQVRGTGADPERLRAMRLRAGLSLRDAAALCGCYFQRIKSAEQLNRVQPVDDELLQRLARAYKCDITDFYTKDDEQPKE